MTYFRACACSNEPSLADDYRNIKRLINTPFPRQVPKAEETVKQQLIITEKRNLVDRLKP